MGYLRKNRDAIVLVLAWALLLQSTLLAFAWATAAAAAASGDASIICTSSGIVAGKDLPQPKRHGSHLNCCSLACRAACSGGAVGILPEAAAALPYSDFGSRKADRPGALRFDSADIFAAKPRGPPIA
jgi:hypothetical protein